jgi:hypothetical protein
MSRSASTLLIVIAVAIACGHIVSAQRVYEPSLHRDEANSLDRRPLWPRTRPAPLPMYGSNDRSRWAAVRALVDDGSFVIGKRDLKTLYASAVAPLGLLEPVTAAALFDAGYRARIASDSGIIFEDGWQSVDKVLDPDTMQYYSSKPPLLSVLIAGLYWLLKFLTGWSLSPYRSPSGAIIPGRPNEVIRTLLLITNGVPFAVYLWQLSRLVQKWGWTDWGRMYVLGAGAFATLVGPFLITLNNHTIATFAVMFAWVSLLQIAAVHLRAGDPMMPAAKPRTGQPPWYHFVAAGLFAAFAAANELPALALVAAVLVLLLWWYPGRTLLFAVPPALLVGAAFFATNYAELGTWKVAYAETESVWYQYEGSHWRLPPGQMKYGIDWARKTGREGPATYAAHVLTGHHGWFSLTPIWALSLAAMLISTTGLIGYLLRVRRLPSSEPGVLPWFVHPLALVLSVIVIAFYLVRSDNYGGWTNGLRWLMWLTPMWLTCLLPIADLLAEGRWGRALGYALLAVSVFSMSYEPWNPWRHPWIYDLMQEMGWEGY